VSMKEYITDIKELNSKKVLIYINDAPSFALYKNEPEKLGIHEGEVFDEAKKNELYGDTLYKRALNRSLGLIKTRDHTINEIKTKLGKEYYPDEIIHKLICFLKENNFLDDKRYAAGYISYYSATKSLMLIKQELIKKGVDKSVIEEEMAGYSEQNPDIEEKLIFKLLSSKYDPDITFDDEKDKYKFKSKVFAFLLRKGFSSGMAREAIKAYFDI